MTTSPPLKHRSLAAIVPVFNESSTIDEVIRNLDSLDFITEIILVDDGSTDDLSSKILSFQKTNKLKVIRHEKNLGKTQAVCTGVECVNSDFVVIQDADAEYFPADLRKLLEKIALGEADLVFGSRRMNDGFFSRKNFNPFYLCVTLLNIFIFILYRCRLTDAATCYKMMPTSLLRSIQLSGKRFEICPEIIAKSVRMGRVIAEVSINYQRRTVAEGKKIRFRDAIDAFATLWRLRDWQPTKLQVEWISASKEKGRDV